MRGSWGVAQAEVPWGPWGPSRAGGGGTAGPNNALEPTAPRVGGGMRSFNVARRLTAGRSAPRGGHGVAGEREGAPGSLQCRCQGRVPSSQRGVCGRVSPLSAVGRQAGVGGAAVPHVSAPQPVRATCPASRVGGARGVRTGAPCTGTAGPPRHAPWLGWRAAVVCGCPSRRRTVGGWPGRLALALARGASPRRSVRSWSWRAPWLGWSGAVTQVWPSRGGPGGERCARGLRASAREAAIPAPVPMLASVRGRRSAHGVACGAKRSAGGHGGSRADAPGALPAHVGRGVALCPARCHPAGVSRRRRGWRRPRASRAARRRGRHGANGIWAGRKSGAQRGRTRACT